MPKPNTRFLRHIIKGTDFHNKTLLAKEAAESKARLKDLERASETNRLKTNPSTRDIRRRQMGDIQAILGGSKRSRTRDEKPQDEASTSKTKDKLQIDKHRQQKRDRSRDRDKERRRSIEHKDSENKERRSRRGRSSQDDSHSSRHSRDKERHDRHSTRQSERSRYRSKSPRRRRSRSPGHTDKDRARHRQRSASRHGRRPRNNRDSNELVVSDVESLDESIGPTPAPKLRGRGASGFSSGIDRRFSESYDPKEGTGMDDDDTKTMTG